MFKSLAICFLVFASSASAAEKSPWCAGTWNLDIEATLVANNDTNLEKSVLLDTAKFLSSLTGVQTRTGVTMYVKISGNEWIIHGDRLKKVKILDWKVGTRATVFIFEKEIAGVKRRLSYRVEKYVNDLLGPEPRIRWTIGRGVDGAGEPSVFQIIWKKRVSEKQD